MNALLGPGRAGLSALIRRFRLAGRARSRTADMDFGLTEDVDRLVKFYTNSFGLKIVHGVGTATYLTDGHINLALIPIGPEREIEGNQLKEGINHFGFEVESVEALVPVCRQWGAATDVKKRPPNREAESRVWDPDGNPIDLSQHGWPH